MTIIKSTNISLSRDIRDVLNAAGGKADNTFGSLFREENINKWSRYKPVSYDKVTALSEQEFKLANYGLSNYYMGRTMTPRQLMDLAIQGTDFYPYEPPTGGEASPYRVSDFRGYNTKAEAPYLKQGSDTLEPVQFPATLSYLLMVNTNAELKISELASFEDVIGTTSKIGILWTSGDGIYYLYYEPDTTLDAGMDLTLPIAQEGTYHFLAVWFNMEVLKGNNDVTDKAINFVPIPDTYQKTVVTQKQVWGKVSVDWDALDNLSYYNVNGVIQGFSTSYPNFNLTFPNGSTPSCVYRIGLFVFADIDGDTRRGIYWYDDEYINHAGGDDDSSVVMVNFPTELSLSDILGFSIDGQTVENITVRLDMERVDGYGFLGLDDDLKEYNVTIY